MAHQFESLVELSMQCTLILSSTIQDVLEGDYDSCCHVVVYFSLFHFFLVTRWSFKAKHEKGIVGDNYFRLAK